MHKQLHATFTILGKAGFVIIPSFINEQYTHVDADDAKLRLRATSSSLLPSKFVITWYHHQSKILGMIHPEWSNSYCICIASHRYLTHRAFDYLSEARALLYSGNHSTWRLCGTQKI
eukprot:scaffold106239_cov42-Prasinocladus_malaysianus.AAC.1